MWKVIIADDEKLICRLVQALVDWEALDMRVEAMAENGPDALQKIEEIRPDVLITDIRMPGLNGLELIKQAKQITPQLEIIIISGYAHFEYAQNAIALGVRNYILKPIKQDELCATLQNVVKHLKEKREKDVSYGIWEEGDSLEKSVLRKRLVSELRNGQTALTGEVLRKEYGFEATQECYQTFVLQMDMDSGQTNRNALNLLKEKGTGLLTECLSRWCADATVGFWDYTGYGVLNYQAQNREHVRFQLRELLRRLEGKKNLFGEVEFTLALGGETGQPEKLADSLKWAERIIEERLVEGCGKMLEGIPESSGVQKQVLLEHFAKETEHAIEVLDLQEAHQAAEKLKEDLLSVKDIRGGEILDIVLKAGNFFLFRLGAEQSEKLQRTFTESCMHQESVDRLFGELCKLQQIIFTELVENREKDASRPIREAKQYIKQNYKNNITLEEVAEYVGFSASYFSVFFKKETGEGFAKYLTRIRIEEAKELLRETGLPVAEICERVGYSDRKHFTYTFHKMTGVNPAQYRKLYG